MSHVMLSAPIRGGICYFCECGRVLGKITRPFNEVDHAFVSDMIQAHREHARLQLGVLPTMRLGTTTGIATPFLIVDEAVTEAELAAVLNSKQCGA